MRYLLLNGDRQDAFWRLACQSSSVAVTELNVFQDDPGAVNRWGIPAVPCVVDVTDDQVTAIATTLDQLQALPQ